MLGRGSYIRELLRLARKGNEISWVVRRGAGASSSTCRMVFHLSAVGMSGQTPFFARGREG